MPKCIHEKCTNIALYGIETTTHCSLHRTNDMINQQIRKCDHPNCNTIPSYGYAYEDVKNARPIRCKTHKTSDMIMIVKIRKCTECNISASFGLPTDQKPSKCFQHKTSDMINKVLRKCIICNKTSASYGENQGESPTHCAKCKTSNLVPTRKNITNNNKRHKAICNYQNCKTCASYGYSDKKPTKCAKHKESDMINRVSKRCDYNDNGIKCDKIAIYKTRCTAHKLKDALIRDKPICDYSNCKKYAYFARVNTNQPIRCSNHADADMIRVIGLKCLEPDCNRIPTYGHTKRIYCGEHKEDSMINLISTKCNHKN